ncbi:hypothetical protein V6Z11_A01G137700 [Gossypium hirsutum]
MKFLFFFLSYYLPVLEARRSVSSMSRCMKISHEELSNSVAPDSAIRSQLRKIISPATQHTHISPNFKFTVFIIT